MNRRSFLRMLPIAPIAVPFAIKAAIDAGAAPQARKLLPEEREEFRRLFCGGAEHELFHGIPPKDARMILARRYGWDEICRFVGGA